MKPTNLILFIVIFISCTTSKPSMQTFADNPVVAHRGAFKKNAFPENSIAALKEAIRLKCTGSEFDVRMSADDTLLINHDEDYNGLDIEKATYSQLAAKKLSNGEQLPTLREYLIAGLEGNTSTQLVLEIKPSASKERGQRIAEKVLNLVNEVKASKMVTYISFDYDMLKKLEQLDPTVITQYLNGDVSPQQLKADGIDGADYHFSVFKKHPEWILMAKQNRILLNAWTVNEKADMLWLLSEGFHFITTNEPELLFSLLKK
jgi:glycerophosphoryl diester phosphodiesterase